MTRTISKGISTHIPPVNVPTPAQDTLIPKPQRGSHKGDATPSHRTRPASCRKKRASREDSGKIRFARPLNSEGQTKEAKWVTTRMSTLPHTSKLRDSATTSCWHPHKPERAENKPSVNNPPCVQANPTHQFSFRATLVCTKVLFLYTHTRRVWVYVFSR